MKALFRGALVYDNGIMKKQDVVFDGVSLSAFDGDVTPFSSSAIFDSIAVFPGFCDVHVHFREPGFSYKETMESGSSAAAHGGYTAVLTMPNLNPSPDSIEGAREQLAAIRRGASIAVI
ncbi:MAG: amidohydrolase family protein, partial [Clostridia bacterium]|nr:amidohydrolase family protein [Clostridia bacterium]